MELPTREQLTGAMGLEEKGRGGKSKRQELPADQSHGEETAGTE